MNRSKRLVYRSSQTSRTAYTLIETILALSLTLVLMTTVVTATSLYWKFRANTANLMTPAILLAGVADDIASDVRAIVGTDGSSLGLTGTLASGQSDSSIGEKLLVFGKDSQEKPIHLVGNNTSLAMLRSGRNSRFSFDAQPDLAREHTVLWLSPQKQDTRLAIAHNGGRTIERTFTRPMQSKGVVRIVTDSAMQTSHSIEEVTRVQFQYYDGIRWYREWNSFLKKDRLPHAIELTLEVEGKEGQLFRTVIAVPAGLSEYDRPTLNDSFVVPLTTTER